MTEAEQIMKRCQAGTRNYEEANNLHAACYGMIGKLLEQRKPLTPDQAFAIADQHPVEGFDPDIMAFIRAIEAAHGIKENKHDKR